VSLLTAWLLFPLILSLLALGCGLLLEQVSGGRLAGPLVAPAGVAVMIVVAGFTTFSAATAFLTVPTVVALAVAGHAFRFRRPNLRGAALPIVAAGLVFCAYAAPVVMSGRATFAGYIKLDDTATFLALTDRVLEHGHSLAGLAPSSYEATLSINLAHGYPVGALLPFGIGRALVGIDGAWVFQPYLAFMAAMLALVLFDLSGRVLRSTRLRTVCAVLSAQPALLYGFSLWGGVKELAAAPLVALVAALAPTTAGQASSRRSVLPTAMALAAVLCVLSIGGVVWLFVPLALISALVVRKRVGAARAGVLIGGVVLLSLPTLVAARSFLSPATETAVRSQSVLGNLYHPLSALQVLGVWPTGDFRVDPRDLAATRILLALVVVATVVGASLAVRARAWSPVLYVGSGAFGCAVVAALGSPWIVAKAYAIGSPGFLFAAVVGCALLIAGGRGIEGFVALAVIAAGVLWSNALAYHDVNLAPRQQLVELERIGERFAGDGPALMTEYQPYGVRHFLRRLDAEGTSELRRRDIPLRNGTLLTKGAYADLAAFQSSAIDVYRTLVLRRSPFATRPPARYRLVWRGRFYDVWQSGGQPVHCKSRLLTSRAEQPGIIGLARSDSLASRVSVSHAGRYSVWIGGSFRGSLTVAVDGRIVATRGDQLDNAGQYTRFGAIAIAPGTHFVEVRSARGGLRPGGGGQEYGVGSLVLRREPDVDQACAAP
jgi:hypothetical protein